MNTLKTVYDKVKSDYVKSVNENRRLMMIDALLVYAVLTGAAQMLFCVLVGTFPFNSFLSGFLCHVGLFALGVSLRLQITSAAEFKNISPEKAYFDFAVCCLVLFFIVVSFMG